MLVFLSMLAAGILLLSLIFFLHRQQYREKVDAVDRTLPLPPLDGKDRQRVLNMAAGIAPDFEAEQSLALHERDWLTAILGADSQVGDIDLQSQSRQHSLDKNYDQALLALAKAFPQMGAFRKAAQLVRARIRELRKSAVPWDQELKRLYLIAAWADLLHGKWEGSAPPSPSQLKRLNMLRHQNLPMDYKQLGFLHFALLGKNDAKLMAECWGEPSSHLHAREIHGEALLTIFDSLESQQDHHARTS